MIRQLRKRKIQEMLRACLFVQKDGKLLYIISVSPKEDFKSPLCRMTQKDVSGWHWPLLSWKEQDPVLPGVDPLVWICHSCMQCLCQKCPSWTHKMPYPQHEAPPVMLQTKECISQLTMGFTCLTMSLPSMKPLT